MDRNSVPRLGRIGRLRRLLRDPEGHASAVLEVKPTNAAFGEGSFILDHRSINRSASDDGTGGTGKTGKRGQLLVDTRHPEWSKMHALWKKWRLTYEGGEDFVEVFLKQYSDREQKEDWEVRKNISYNPNHAGALIDGIRNALMVKMPEVTRKGDPEFERLTEHNVDMQNSSMSTFIGLEVVPLLLAQGKRFVGVDAPQIFNKAQQTKADEDGSPYIWAIDAEEVLSWSHDDNGRFTSILIHETVNVVDPATQLVSGTKEQFRFMLRLEPGMSIVGMMDSENNEMPPILIPAEGAVLVKVMDKDDVDQKPAVILDIPQIPIVEFRLVDSLMSDIADMQIALLNLASTDMSFLFRGNFPIYIEQFDPLKAALKPISSRKVATSFENESSGRDKVIEEEALQNVRETGNNRGIGYPEGLDAPAFIAPQTANLTASMEKQEAISQAMRSLMNMSLVSIAVKAIEQSGKSKEADRLGEEAALATIAGELQTGERGIAEHLHRFLGSSLQPDQIEVKYPVGHSLKTPEERRTEAKELAGMSGAVRSATYSKAIQKRVAEILLGQQITDEEMEAIREEIAEQIEFDADQTRADLVHKDVQFGLIPKDKASRLRGYEEGDAEDATIETELELDRLAGPTIPSDTPPTEEE